MNNSSARRLQKVAEADFPTPFGFFRIFGFRLDASSGTAAAPAEEAVALKMGEMTGNPPLVRIHSQCLTGDVFHSLRCDCRAQLDIALESVGAEGRGLIIYELQEGRGIGLLNKLRAYELQDAGADTVEANERLGFDSDLRHYVLPGAILRYFGLNAVRLLSNNPDKVLAVENAGVRVVERVPCLADVLDTRETYLRTKKEKMGHLLEGF
jgi:GTP cyclohydrolase II